MEEKLIEFVRNNRFLYDKSSPQYKNIPLRDKKFEELSKELNIPAKKLKARWRTLRDKFNKEIHKINLPPKSWLSEGKQWKWMEHLMFLRNMDTFVEEKIECDKIEDVIVEEEGEITELVTFVKKREKKPMAHNFFSMLADQVDDAEISPQTFIELQVAMLQKFNEIVYQK